MSCASRWRRCGASLLGAPSKLSSRNEGGLRSGSWTGADVRRPAWRSALHNRHGPHGDPRYLLSTAASASGATGATAAMGACRESRSRQCRPGLLSSGHTRHNAPDFLVAFDHARRKKAPMPPTYHCTIMHMFVALVTWECMTVPHLYAPVCPVATSSLDLCIFRILTSMTRRSLVSGNAAAHADVAGADFIDQCEDFGHECWGECAFHRGSSRALVGLPSFPCSNCAIGNWQLAVVNWQW
jgi:hypothetical protein